MTTPRHVVTITTPTFYLWVSPLGFVTDYGWGISSEDSVARRRAAQICDSLCSDQRSHYPCTVYLRRFALALRDIRSASPLLVCPLLYPSTRSKAPLTLVLRYFYATHSVSLDLYSWNDTLCHACNKSLCDSGAIPRTDRPLTLGRIL